MRPNLLTAKLFTVIGLLSGGLVDIGCTALVDHPYPSDAAVARDGGGPPETDASTSLDGSPAPDGSPTTPDGAPLPDGSMPPLDGGGGQDGAVAHGLRLRSVDFVTAATSSAAVSPRLLRGGFERGPRSCVGARCVTFSFGTGVAE
jgi:hypothetical protein